MSSMAREPFCYVPRTYVLGYLLNAPTGLSFAWGLPSTPKVHSVKVPYFYDRDLRLAIRSENVQFLD